jgi:hypothetical protein
LKELIIMKNELKSEYVYITLIKHFIPFEIHGHNNQKNMMNNYVKKIGINLNQNKTV